jgi:hypothetical protein
LVSLDNVGIWNLRTENLDSWYLGQETYIRVVNPEPTNKTELPMPDNALFCGSLQHLQKYVTLSFSINYPKLKNYTPLLNFDVHFLFSGLKKLSRTLQSMEMG